MDLQFVQARALVNVVLRSIIDAQNALVPRVHAVVRRPFRRPRSREHFPGDFFSHRADFIKRRGYPAIFRPCFQYETPFKSRASATFSNSGLL